MARIAFHYDKEKRQVLKMIVGPMTRDELLDQEFRQMRHPDFPPAARMIVDISFAQMPDVTENDIKSMTRIYEAYPQIARGAQVAILSTTEYAKAQLFEIHARPHGVNVISFNMLETACSWLGMDIVEVREWMTKTREELMRQE
jgi:hypothetical protein